MRRNRDPSSAGTPSLTTPTVTEKKRSILFQRSVDHAQFRSTAPSALVTRLRRAPVA